MSVQQAVSSVTPTVVGFKWTHHFTRYSVQFGAPINREYTVTHVRGRNRVSIDRDRTAPKFATVQAAVEYLTRKVWERA